MQTTGLTISTTSVSTTVSNLRWILEVFLKNRTLLSLDFTMNRVLVKLFKTSNIEIIEECRRFFHVELPAICATSETFSEIFVTVVTTIAKMVNKIWVIS